MTRGHQPRRLAVLIDRLGGRAGSSDPTERRSCPERDPQAGGRQEPGRVEGFRGKASTARGVPRPGSNWPPDA
jgi:hypothetical protein